MIEGLPDAIVKLLQEMWDADPEATQDLLCIHTECNQKLQDHPTVQVAEAVGDDGKKYIGVGLLGVLNGLCGVDKRGYGPVQVICNDRTEKIQGFRVDPEWTEE